MLGVQLSIASEVIKLREKSIKQRAIMVLRNGETGLVMMICFGQAVLTVSPNPGSTCFRTHFFLSHSWYQRGI